MNNITASRVVLTAFILVASLGFSTQPFPVVAKESTLDQRLTAVIAQEAPVCKFGVARTFSASFDKVFAASLAVLEEKGEPTSLDDPGRGLINTGSITVDNERLREIIREEAVNFIGQQDGRYLLSFCLETVSEISTTVTVVPLILVNSVVDNPLGGQPVASNGTLEREHLDAIAEKIGGTIPRTPRAIQNCCELNSNLSPSSANVQVNQADHTSSTLDNSTSQSETSIAVSGSTIVVGWNDSSQFAVTGLGGLTSMTGYGFSTDGGSTFTDANLLASAPGFINLGDPALAVDRTGNFYFASLAFDTLPSIFGTFDSRIAVAQSTSTSPTVTFGTPVLISGFLTTGFAVQDKELIAVDTSGGSFDGTVYVTWSEFASLFDFTPKVLFARSTSTTPLAFATPIALSPTDALNHGAMPAVGPNGEVYVVWGRFVVGGGGITAQSIRILKSTDGGVTFSNPDPADPAPNKTVASPTPAPEDMDSGGIDIRTRGFPYIAVDTTPAGSPTRGNIYITFQADPDGAGPDRSDVFFTRSTDGGITWSTPVSANAGAAVTTNPDTTTNDNWQPSIAVSPSSGDIAVTFYDRRNDTTAADGDPANTKITLFKSISRDAGLTWSNEQVSDVAFTPSTGHDPLTASTYMGDYNYAVADASNFHMTWGDTRNLCTPPPGALNPCSAAGRPDQDVFYAKEAIISDLSITKADSPDPVMPGQNITYNLTVTNNGSSNTTGVIISDTLPAGVTFDAGTSTPGCTDAGGVVTCTVANLANGANASITITVKVDPATTCGSTLTNMATVQSNVSDPNLGDNTANADTMVTCPADLSITKSDAPDPLAAGGTLTYSLTVTNNGPGDATAVTVTDTLPAGVTFDSATSTPGCAEAGGIVTCTVGNLANSASTTITIIVKVDPATPAGTITNTAAVAGQENDPNMVDNTATTDTTIIPPATLCTILDDFNRADGPLGSNWAGHTSGYRIRNNQVAVRRGRPIYWQPEAYGPHQEACVTLTRINPKSRQHALLLKVQELNNWRKGAIMVSYNARSGNVEVKARDVVNHKWILVGSFIPATPVVDGDQLRARAFADGTVDVLINNTSIGTADAGSFYAGKGGQIGLWIRGRQADDDEDDSDHDRSIHAKEHDDDEGDDSAGGRPALLDDFGGGTIAAP